MNEQPTNTRPTKKQRELLSFIEQFIGEHGYSPSYREIMAGLNYTSVATVSLHVTNLITRGHLRKRDYSARSLEVVAPAETVMITTNQISAKEERWLVEKIEHVFSEAESGMSEPGQRLADLQTLVSTLQILGLDGAASSFTARLSAYRPKSLDG
jgi:SOS-response transcriptional repressor LexA